jgi:hypothetical protein
LVHLWNKERGLRSPVTPSFNWIPRRHQERTEKLLSTALVLQPVSTRLYMGGSMAAKANMAMKMEPALRKRLQALGEEFRDLVAPFGGGAYVLRHRIDDDALVIVRVWHRKEDRD